MKCPICKSNETVYECSEICAYKCLKCGHRFNPIILEDDTLKFKEELHNVGEIIG